MATHYPNFAFQVRIEDREVKCSKVLNLSFKNNIIDNRTGENKSTSSENFMGRQSFDNVILQRPVTQKDEFFYTFWKDQGHLDAEGKPALVTISLLDETHAPVVTWTLNSVLPVSLTYSDLDSNGNQLVYENLEINFENLDIQFH